MGPAVSADGAKQLDLTYNNKKKSRGATGPPYASHTAGGSVDDANAAATQLWFVVSALRLLLRRRESIEGFEGRIPFPRTERVVAPDPAAMHTARRVRFAARRRIQAPLGPRAAPTTDPRATRPPTVLAALHFATRHPAGSAPPLRQRRRAAPGYEEIQPGVTRL